jgi:hypothetical protein
MIVTLDGSPHSSVVIFGGRFSHYQQVTTRSDALKCLEKSTS